MSKKIYRDAALQAKSESKAYLGTVIIYLPRGFRKYFIGLGALFFAFLGIAFLARYTNSITVSGELYSSKGIVPIFSPKDGIVISVNTEELQRVSLDQPLVKISYERYGLDNIAASRSAISLAKQRYEAKNEEMIARRSTIEKNRISLKSRLRSYEMEASVVEDQLRVLQDRQDISFEMMLRYQDANKIEAASAEEVAEKRLSASTSVIAHKEKQQQLIVIRRAILESTSQLQALDNSLIEFDAQTRGASIEFEQQNLQNRAEQGSVIVAPVDGQVIAVQAHVGQKFTTATPLIFLLPKGSQIEARLLLPSRAAGFVEKGQSVKLRYSAYPYQKFGQALGTITSISSASFSASEISFLDRISLQEPVYLVTVKLEKEHVEFKDRTYHLKPGMKIDAEIALESKRVYEWLLDPAISAFQKLK